MTSQTSIKGNISESAFQTDALKAGFTVLIPYGDGHRYDIVLEKDGKFSRIQIKTGKLSDDKSFINFSTCSQNQVQGRKTYDGEVDYFGVYCPQINKSYLVPIVKTGSSRTRLRLIKAKNNQSKGINLAEDFIISKP